MDGLSWIDQTPNGLPLSPPAAISPPADLNDFARSAMGRVESTIAFAIDCAVTEGCPPRLAEAMRYTVFPGGARIRPRLSLAVAWACGDDDPRAAAGAGASIELMHCASLVHDDLPCFDDADRRRGKPTVHLAFGEPLAVLTGDALIVMAFETLVRCAARKPRPSRIARLDPRPRHRRVQRHHGRPGLGMRSRDRYGALSSGEDRIAVCGCDDGRRSGSRGKPDGLAHAGRVDRRSLSGRR